MQKDILTTDYGGADLIPSPSFSSLFVYIPRIHGAYSGVLGIETRMEIQIGTGLSTFHSRRGHEN